MSQAAGMLKHRIEIHQLLDIQDPDTGNVESDWSLFADAWAHVRSLSVNEFVAAGAAQSKISVAIRIRPINGVKPSMRVRHGERLYQIEGPPLNDPHDGRQWMTLMCSEVVDG